MKLFKELTPEEYRLYGFEYTCNACDNFCTCECPFNVQDPDTLWRKEDGGLGCDKFMD